MPFSFRKLFEHNILLKFFSLLFGICFWFTWGGQQPTTFSHRVPICFFGSPDAQIADLPDTVEVTLHGTRNELYKLDFSQLAWHISTDNLTPGKHHLEPTNEALLLPSTIKVLHWSPAPLVISMLDREMAAETEKVA